MNQPFHDEEQEQKNNKDLRTANQRKRITNIKYGFVILVIIILILLIGFVL